MKLSEIARPSIVWKMRRGAQCAFSAGEVRAKIYAACALAVISAQPAFAAEWTIKPSISVQESITDNANSGPPGQEKGDLISTVTPGVSIRGEGARLNLSLDYALSGSHYLDNDNLDRIQH